MPARSDRSSCPVDTGQPPRIPWVTRRHVWLKEEGVVVKVPVRSPRLRQASRETGVILDEVVNRERSSFGGHGVHPQVAETQYELWEGRRMQKLRMLLAARAIYVRRDDEAAAASLRKDKAPGGLCSSGTRVLSYKPMIPMGRRGNRPASSGVRGVRDDAVATLREVGRGKSPGDGVSWMTGPVDCIYYEVA